MKARVSCDNLITESVRTKCGKVTSWAEIRSLTSPCTMFDTTRNQNGQIGRALKIKVVFSSNLSDYMCRATKTSFTSFAS